MDPICLTFLPDVSVKKPNDVRGQSTCPFCQCDNLQKILVEEADALWIENKYRTIEKTYQTVVIESKQHDFDMATCSVEALARLLTFMFDCWEKLSADPRFQSVIMFKNKGPYSGASLRHPHTQIVGLEEWDMKKQTNPVHFEGKTIYQEQGLEANVSTHPVMGYLELNVTCAKTAPVDRLAWLLQGLLRYMADQPARREDVSYNLFGWTYPDHYQLKIVPRYIDSAYYIGFGIAQVFPEKDLERLATLIRQHYLE